MTGSTPGCGVTTDGESLDPLLIRALSEAPVPFLLLRRDAPGAPVRVLTGNRALATLLGAHDADVAGRVLADALDPLGVADLADRIAEALPETRVATVGPLTVRSGRRRREMAFLLYRLGPAVFGCVLRDVTDETTRLAELHERLRLNERLASIGTLGAGLGHDLGNLLMPLRAHVDALEAGGGDGSAREHIASIREALDYLQQLTNGLRLFALDPEDATASAGTTELSAWWEQLRPLLARTVPAHLSLDVDLPPDLPAVAVATHRLTQAVLNLLINSSEAVGAEGRIHLEAHATEDGRFVRLGVRDNGRGMGRETRRHAFDPFFTTKRRGRSTGLGLSLVHGIARAAGGSVEIESTPGHGTTVTMILPAASPRAPAAAAGGESRPRAVVSIEDERVAACFVSFLQSAGFEVASGGGPPAGSAVWVTDATPAAHRRAERLAAKHPGCRVIAFGRSPLDWHRLGSTVLDEAGGLRGIRRAIRQLMIAVEKQHGQTVAEGAVRR